MLMHSVPGNGKTVQFFNCFALDLDYPKMENLANVSFIFWIRHKNENKI